MRSSFLALEKSKKGGGWKSKGGKGANAPSRDAGSGDNDNNQESGLG